MAGDQKLEMLKRVPLFAGCGTADLQEIERLADEVAVSDGQVLLREGAIPHEFFLVLQGQVRIEQGGRNLRTLGPGDFLGEIALIDGGVRSASAIAQGPGRVAVLGHREFHSLMDRHPGIRLAILQALAERVRRTDPDPAA